MEFFEAVRVKRLNPRSLGGKFWLQNHLCFYPLKGLVKIMSTLHIMGSATYSGGKNKRNFNGSPKRLWEAGKCGKCNNKKRNSSVHICFSLWYIWMITLLSQLLTSPDYPTFGYPTFRLSAWVRGHFKRSPSPILKCPLTHALKIVQEKFAQQRKYQIFREDYILWRHYIRTSLPTTLFF